MATVEQEGVGGADASIFDWRFASLVRAGYLPDQAWRLATSKHVDVRLAERLLAQGCPTSTAVRILL
jgi:hypothetical protein